MHVCGVVHIKLNGVSNPLTAIGELIIEDIDTCEVIWGGQGRASRRDGGTFLYRMMVGI